MITMQMPIMLPSCVIPNIKIIEGINIKNKNLFLIKLLKFNDMLCPMLLIASNCMAGVLQIQR